MAPRIKCPCCGSNSTTVEKRRMSTAYLNEESNWLTSCLPCFEEAEEYWAERWAEYYSDCL